MALDPNVLALTRDGVAARPRDLMAEADPKLYPSPLLAGNGQTAVPHVWEKSSNGAVRWVAVFAWQSDPSYATELDLPAGATEIAQPTAPGNAPLRPIHGHVHVDVPAHGVRLFRLSP